ncbi:Nitrogen permease regulator 2-like protein [Cercospora zeina]
MLQAIFYARFHPERGPSVIHQYPSNTIKSSDPISNPPLINWSEVSSYIIAPYDLCNSPLSICNNGHRILGYPISLEHEDYDRNRFTFNMCLVLDEDEDAKPWERIVEKIAKFCVALEWNGCVLQHEEDQPGVKLAETKGGTVQNAVHKGRVNTLLERIFEDLNHYGETCIRVDNVKGEDGVYVLNLRLETEKDFAKRTPKHVRSWDVPLLVRNLPDPGEWTWDLTLQRIFGFIDGIRHMKKIAELADVEIKLVKRAVKELVYHGRAVLLDVFHFQAIYACTPEVADFFQNEELQDECRKYIAIHEESEAQKQQDSRKTDTNTLPSREHIIALYADLQPGLQLQEFCLTHKSQLANIDIRRLITFGLLKGFLRRNHKYAFSSTHPLHLPQRSLSPILSRRSAGTMQKSFRSGNTATTKSGDEAVREFERAWRKAALTSGWATPPSGPHPSSLSKSQRGADQVRSEEDERLRGFLDGEHCLDAICVEMGLSEKKVLERLRGFGRSGEVVLFNK